MYYAAMRPGEVVALTDAALDLPAPSSSAAPARPAASFSGPLRVLPALSVAAP
jgi:hypothetical protein